MPNEMFLRVSDTLLAVFFAWLLIVSLNAGRIGGASGYMAGKTERPGQYWFGIFILALMVVHFAGLAYVGQKLG